MSSRRASVGVDLGTRVIKVAWQRRGGQQIESAAFTRQGDDDAHELERVSRLLGLRGVRRPVVGLYAPDRLVRSAVVDVPSKGGQAPREAIAEQAFHRELDLPPGTRQLRISDTPASSRRGSAEQMLVMGVESEACALICESAWSAGLDVACVCTSAEAAAYEATMRGDSGVMLILDMGWTTARVMLVKDGQVTLHRASSNIGLRDVVIPVSEQLVGGVEDEASALRALDLAEALLVDAEAAERHRALWSGPIERWAQLLGEDVRSGLAYAMHRYPEAEVGECIGVGGGALLPLAADALRAQLMCGLSLDVDRAHTWQAEAMVRALASIERAKGAAA